MFNLQLELNYSKTESNIRFQRSLQEWLLDQKVIFDLTCQSYSHMGLLKNESINSYKHKGKTWGSEGTYHPSMESELKTTRRPIYKFDEKILRENCKLYCYYKAFSSVELLSA